MGKACLIILKWEKGGKLKENQCGWGRGKRKEKRFNLSFPESHPWNKGCDPESQGEGQTQRKAHKRVYECVTELVTALSNQGAFCKDLWRVSDQSPGTSKREMFIQWFPPPLSGVVYRILTTLHFRLQSQQFPGHKEALEESQRVRLGMCCQVGPHELVKASLKLFVTAVARIRGKAGPISRGAQGVSHRVRGTLCDTGKGGWRYEG